MSEARLRIVGKLGFFKEPHRYKVAYGGRGGGKSHSIARMLLVRAIKKKTRVLCTRELQVSIADSVHKVLKDLISEFKLGYYYTVQNTTIRGRNGSEFIFSGLRMNVSKIKSMEGVDIVWIEEAESVSRSSWEILIPTIRKDDSEIWVSFNPLNETDPTYKMFVTNPPPDAKVVKVGWQDNPWFPERLRKHKDYLYSVDKDTAEHVYGGGLRKFNKAQVLAGKVSVEPFVPAADWDGPYQGADWGFAADPTVLVRSWIHEHKGEDEDKPLRDLYIEREAYGVGVEVVDTPEMFDTIPDARKYVTRADKSRPETISHMRHNGYGRIVAAEQTAGSVEDGVMHLRSFSKIIIHPRCVNAIQESRDWSWKTDRLTGDILPILVDKHDHCWDAIRYALEPIMKKQKLSYDYKSVIKKRTMHQTKKKSGGFGSRSGGIL